MKKLNYLLIVAGIIGVVSAIAVTPDVATKYFSPNQHISSQGLHSLRVYRLLALASGLYVLTLGTAFLVLGLTPRDLNRVFSSPEYRLLAAALITGVFMTGLVMTAAYFRLYVIPGGAAIRNLLLVTGFLTLATGGRLACNIFKDRLPSTLQGYIGFNTVRRKRVALGLITLAGVGATLWMVWTTVIGPGVTPDSVTYIETACSLLAGEGFWARGQPMTHYPPGYPVLLSACSVVYPGDTLQAARLLAAVLFGANVALLGLVVGLCTEYSVSATLCMLLFALFSAPTLNAHAMVWSEAPFITFSIAALLLLSLHIAQSSRQLHVLASILASLAIATRYIGVTVLPPMAFGLLFLSSRPIKRRLIDTSISLSLALLPLALWLVRNLTVAGTATNRSFAAHLVQGGHVLMLAGTVYQFILPLPIPLWGMVVSFALVCALFLLGLVVLRRKKVRHLVAPVTLSFTAVCAVFCASYIVFLAMSISFFDAHTPVNSRILLPVLLPFTAAGIVMARSLSRALDRKSIWLSFVFVAGLSIGLNGHVAISTATHIRRNGRGYTSVYWQDSETLSYLATIPNGRKVFSNGHDVVRFLTEKEALRLPVKTHPTTRQPNQEYEEQLCKVLSETREGRALIVYLDGITSRWYLPSRDELESNGNLPVVARFDDGVIYGRD